MVGEAIAETRIQTVSFASNGEEIYDKCQWHPCVEHFNRKNSNWFCAMKCQSGVCAFTSVDARCGRFEWNCVHHIRTTEHSLATWCNVKKINTHPQRIREWGPTVTRWEKCSNLQANKKQILFFFPSFKKYHNCILYIFFFPIKNSFCPHSVFFFALISHWMYVCMSVVGAVVFLHTKRKNNRVVY